MKTRKTFGVQSLVVTFIVIAICEIFFLMDVLADAFYTDITIGWIDHSVLELISTITLAFALIVIGWQINRLLREHRIVEASVKVASGELLAVINARFTSWKLSPSECEVALLLIKGLSTQEIADLRETRLGTVKSQGSAIYQKAGVKGRNELVAYFVEDLLAGDQLMPES
jgi:DNA-binding CsgD family transcriptional regulator